MGLLIVAEKNTVWRSFLDAIGTLPAPEETRAFLADSSPTKRAEWVALLSGYWRAKPAQMDAISAWALASIRA